MRPNFTIVAWMCGISLLLRTVAAGAESFSVALELPAVAISERDGFVDVAGGAGTALSSEPGQPRLPQRILTYALPPDADLSSVAVTVGDTESVELPLAGPVRPAPPWRTSAEAAPFYGAAKTILQHLDADVLEWIVADDLVLDHI